MTSIDVEQPQTLQLSPVDEVQVRRTLRRNRLLATGLLALMVVIAFGTRFAPSSAWLVQLIRAGAEAGIIGGLADWFAITVLFRHPFGIPLPHTAILPNNKDRIGRSLGSFVERNFLVPEVILPKMHQADLTGKIAAWLALPETAPVVADWIITLLKRLLAASHSSQINEFVQHTVGQQLRTLDLAPLLGRLIEVLTTSKESDILFEKVVETAENWIMTNRTQIDEMVPRTLRRQHQSVSSTRLDLRSKIGKRPSRLDRWRKTSRHCRLPSKRSVRKFPLRHRPRQHRSRYAFHLRHPNRYNRPRNNDGFAAAIGPATSLNVRFAAWLRLWRLRFAV
jgi:uncharacterized membrane-anchored protein YjiN (DUF445 family)